MTKEDMKEKKLEELVRRCVEKRNGNRIRHIVRVVAKAYEKNPEKLREYFDEHRQERHMTYEERQLRDELRDEYGLPVPLIFTESYKHDELVAGIATSAYYSLTGDIEPILKTRYGGLGATITLSGSDDVLTFLKKLEKTPTLHTQLQYANVNLILTGEEVKGLAQAVRKLASEGMLMGSGSSRSEGHESLRCEYGTKGWSEIIDLRKRVVKKR